MKICNIFCNNDQKFRNECVNIDISCQSKRNDIINLSPTSIYEYFENEEFDRIIVNDCINFFTGQNQIDFIKNLSNKICRNGTLVLSFHDIEEVARKFLNSKIDLKQFNDILYVENSTNKISVSTLENIKNILHSNGFVINQSNFSDTFCTVSGIKK